MVLHVHVHMFNMLDIIRNKMNVCNQMPGITSIQSIQPFSVEDNIGNNYHRKTH